MSPNDPLEDQSPAAPRLTPGGYQIETKLDQDWLGTRSAPVRLRVSGLCWCTCWLAPGRPIRPRRQLCRPHQHSWPAYPSPYRASSTPATPKGTTSWCTQGARPVVGRPAGCLAHPRPSRPCCRSCSSWPAALDAIHSAGVGLRPPRSGPSLADPGWAFAAVRPGTGLARRLQLRSTVGRAATRAGGHGRA